MSTNPKTQPNRPLREAYPHLWEWASAKPTPKAGISAQSLAFDETLQTVLQSDDLQSLVSDKFLMIDLENSLVALTRRLSKGKNRPTPRLKTLSRWDAALELRTRRTDSRVASMSLTELLREMCPETQRLNELLRPVDPETQIERELKLGCCMVGRESDIDTSIPNKALELLRKMNLDRKDVYILRNLILAINPDSPESAAEILGVTRQTVWNRGNAILGKLAKLGDDDSIRKLVQIASGFSRLPSSATADEAYCLVEPWDVVYDTREPMIAHLTSPASGPFPQYRDLWQVVVFLTSQSSGPHTSEGFPGFLWGQEGVVPQFVGRAYHLFVQDLVPTFFESTLDVDSGQVKVELVRRDKNKRRTGKRRLRSRP